MWTSCASGFGRSQRSVTDGGRSRVQVSDAYRQSSTTEQRLRLRIRWLLLVLLSLPSSLHAQNGKAPAAATKPSSEAGKPGSKVVPAPRPAVTCPDPVPAAIDDPLADEFRAHYQRSVELYRARDYATAIGEMQRAYKLKPVSRLLYNLGQSFRKLSQPREAITYFELYLQTETLVPAEIRAEVQEYLTELRALLAEQERSRVVVVAGKAPPPRWLRPLGGTLLGVGAASIVAGAPLWAIHGSCTAPPTPPMQTCDQVFATLPLGASLVGVGGGLVLAGLGLVVGSIRRSHESAENAARGASKSSPRVPPPPAPREGRPVAPTPTATPPSPPAPPPAPSQVPSSADPNFEPPPAPLQLSLRTG